MPTIKVFIYVYNEAVWPWTQHLSYLASVSSYEIREAIGCPHPYIKMASEVKLSVS